MNLAHTPAIQNLVPNNRCEQNLWEKERRGDEARPEIGAVCRRVHVRRGRHVVKGVSIKQQKRGESAESAERAPGWVGGGGGAAVLLTQILGLQAPGKLSKSFTVPRACPLTSLRPWCPKAHPTGPSSSTFPI